jgi:hypothetical protein
MPSAACMNELDKAHACFRHAVASTEMTVTYVDARDSRPLPGNAVATEMSSDIEHASPYGKTPGEKVPGQKKKIALAAARAYRSRNKVTSVTYARAMEQG